MGDEHKTVSDPAVGSGVLLAEIIRTLNESLNQWYPNRRDDGDAECDARQRLFDLRDKLERIAANAAPEPRGK